MRSYEGNPETGDEWKVLGETSKFDDFPWVVSIRKKPTNETDWRMVKVASVGRAKNKANYWLSWDGYRLARGRDLALMRAGRPDLCEQVCAMLARNSRATVKA